MFHKVLILLTVVTVAFAAPSPQTGGSCNTGPVQCCNSIQPASALSSIPGIQILDLIIQDLSTPIGLDCTPINVGGVGGGGNCNANPACCTGSTFGAFSIGCTPVNLNL